LGKSSFVVLLYTMALLLLPLLGTQSTALALSVAEGFLISALVALITVLIAHALFPVPASAVVAPQAPPPDMTSALHSAWLSTAVVLPPALFCIIYSRTDAVFPLIMVALLSQKADFSVGAAGGKALIAANLGGGLVAAAFYQLLLINPSYVFVVSGTFALALMFAVPLFSGKPMAPLYGSAFSTVLILIGTGSGAFGGEADSKFVTRVVQIVLAVCYVVAALSLLEDANIRERWLRYGRRIRRGLQSVSRMLPGSKNAA
jgi:hypothetical protein